MAHQLRILFSTTKARDEYKHITEDAAQGPVNNMAKIKPLWPTRAQIQRNKKVSINSKHLE